ncbi:MAG: DUF5334 domain-containing protein [Proteobacteria bacterium]|nr:DUF5334 domain-containing protein [Pseudomonadota bacterium]
MKTTSLFLTLLASSLIALESASAWSGYDYENKTEVEIGEGNLVREGLIIQFYDSKLDNYQTVKVLFMEDIAGGTRLQVKDLDTKEERTLIMNKN